MVWLFEVAWCYWSCCSRARRADCRYPMSFFFQAEDGMRCVAVTGVQTCALPIYKRLHARPARFVVQRVREVGADAGKARRRKGEQVVDLPRPPRQGGIHPGPVAQPPQLTIDRKSVV